MAVDRLPAIRGNIGEALSNEYLDDGIIWLRSKSARNTFWRSGGRQAADLVNLATVEAIGPGVDFSDNHLTATVMPVESSAIDRFSNENHHILVLNQIIGQIHRV